MKISVKDNLAVVATGLIYTAPRAAMFFAGAFLGSTILLPAVVGRPLEELSFWIGLISFGVLALYLARQVIDSVLHAKNTSLQISPTGLDCEISGFTSNSFSVPLNQISNIRVSQAFLDKFFGVSSVVVNQISGAFAVYGFDYSDAKKFSQKFSQLQSNVKK